MKHNKILFLTLTAAIMSTPVTIFAAPTQGGQAVNLPTLISTTNQPSVVPISVINQPSVVPISVVNRYTLLVNGSVLDSQKVAYTNDNGSVMIPLRAVAERLGYQVTWNSDNNCAELIKENNFITVKIDDDYYAFGKMAPAKLGTPSVCTEGTTYVPLNFVTDILKLNAKTDKTGAISITSDKASQVTESVYSTVGTVKKINKTEKSTSILIEGKSVGNGYNDSIVLNINNETEIVNPITGETLTLDSIKEGDIVRGYYGPALTRSLPPIGNALKIEVINGTYVERGIITNVNKERRSICVGDAMNGIVLNVSKDIKILSEDGKELTFDELMPGMEVDAYHSMAVTASIPAQSSAKRIIVRH